MVSQSNNIIADCRNLNKIVLCVRVYDNNTMKLVNYFQPMILYGSEINLCGGRFHSYDTTVKDHAVTTTFQNNHPWIQAFNNMVEWIADAAHGHWSFFVATKGEWDTDITFFFDDAQDAMLFRLNIN